MCLNQHHWLANRMRQDGIAFRPCSNAFLQCGSAQRLQELADSLTAKDLLTCGQLRKLAEPTIRENGKRIPGLKLDHPRQLALMHALVRFAHIAAGSTFKTPELYPHVCAALGVTSDQYSLASLRYDLSKLRAKHVVEKVPHSRRYRLRPEGYSICLVFLKLFERIYAPLTAGLLQ
ncbi:MAG TPA: hypothetical protein VMT20_19815, partial [Terriglobia bacterium]|nr:hypothetical protein [Terriglobia bacterium]